MANGAGDLGSVGVGFKVDLKSLNAQMGQAEKIVDSAGQSINKKGAKATGGGLFGSLISGSKEAGLSLSLLGNFSGVLGRVGTSLGGLGRAFAVFGSSAAAGAAGVVTFGAIAVGVIAVIVGVVAVIKTAQFAFQQLGSSIQLAVGQQAVETSFKVMAQNMGISSAAADEFRKTLSGYNLAGAQATKIMQGLLNAQLPLDDSTRSLVEVAQRYAVIAGTDTPTAVSTMTTAISTLNPELLRQFGIVQTLPQIYESYANKLGVTGDSLSTVQQRQAILNTIISQGTRIQGAQNAAQFDTARGMQILKSNIDNFKAAIGKVALPTFTGLLQILVPISRQLGGDTQTLSEKMTSLGNKIAAVVVPAFQRLINFIKNMPWTSIVNGAYQFFQVLRILASVIVFTTKVFIDLARVGVATSKVLAAPFLNLANVIAGVAAIAAKAWDVITGKASFADLKRTFSAAKSSFVDLNKDIFGGFASTVAKTAVNTTQNIGDAINGISDATSKFAKGFNIVDFYKSLPGVSKDAWDAALNDADDGASDMSAKARKALAKLAEELAKENEDFARSQAKAASDFETSLAELVAGHRDQINSIRRDLAKETKDFAKAQDKRAADYQDQIASLGKADKDRKNDVETQLAEEIAKGRFADQTKIASLRSRLEYEDAANKKAVDEANANYQEDTQNAQEEHDERLGDLQTTLDKELAIQDKYADDFARLRDFQVADDITKLKQSYAEQQAEAARAHAEKIQDLVKRGAEEAAQYGANGAANANDYVGALASGLSAGMPTIDSLSKAMGEQSGKSSKEGMQNQSPSIGQKVRDIFTQAAAGAAVGSIFGPVGTLIGAVIGGAIGAMGGTVGGALRTMWNSAIAIMGNLKDYGAAIMKKLGESIRDSLPGPIKGPFRSAWNASGLPNFAYGGIVQGPGGVDNVTAQVSAGEMILNGTQQSRLFSLLSGSLNPDSGSGPGAGGVIIENMEISLPNVRNGQDFSRELQLHFATRRVA